MFDKESKIAEQNFVKKVDNVFSSVKHLALRGLQLIPSFPI